MILKYLVSAADGLVDYLVSVSAAQNGIDIKLYTSSRNKSIDKIRYRVSHSNMNVSQSSYAIKNIKMSCKEYRKVFG